VSTYVGRHERPPRVLTRRLSRRYWHATYRIRPDHHVVAQGASEVQALKELAEMLAENHPRWRP
jgi:hypothetical protein